MMSKVDPVIPQIIGTSHKYTVIKFAILNSAAMTMVSLEEFIITISYDLMWWLIHALCKNT
jgi:hypothetical protein